VDQLVGGRLFLVALLGWVTSAPGIGRWTTNPFEAIPLDAIPGLIGLSLVTGLAVASIGESVKRYWIAFPALFLLTTLAYVLGRQETLSGWGVDQLIWGLVVGLVVSNTVGTPQWLRPALKSELFIKAGLAPADYKSAEHIPNPLPGEALRLPKE
jgi:hypothetical protein